MFQRNAAECVSELVHMLLSALPILHTAGRVWGTGPHAVLRPTCPCSRNAPFNQLGEERANDSRAYGLMCLLGQLLMIEALESAITGP